MHPRYHLQSIQGRKVQNKDWNLALDHQLPLGPCGAHNNMSNSPIPKRSPSQAEFTDNLMKWVQPIAQAKGLSVRNFQSDWQNGYVNVPPLLLQEHLSHILKSKESAEGPTTGDGSAVQGSRKRTLFAPRLSPLADAEYARLQSHHILLTVYFLFLMLNYVYY